MNQDPGSTETARPSYCSRCGHEETTASPLCVTCGDMLRPEGYCPICEAFLKRDAGALCPKHDVELLPEPDPDEGIPLDGMSTKLVTVASYTYPNDASAARIRLEAEGIPTFLVGERVAGTTLWQVATGGVQLQVPETLESAARILLDQTWAPPKTLDEDDAFEELGPDPGAGRRTVMKGVILLILLFPVGVLILAAVHDLITALRNH
jgi:hypothetical protein